MAGVRVWRWGGGAPGGGTKPETNLMEKGLSGYRERDMQRSTAAVENRLVGLTSLVSEGRLMNYQSGVQVPVFRREKKSVV